MQIDLRGSRVLVTGATGFIGARLVEHLILDCGAQVRALVRNFGRSSQIARFSTELVNGDISRPEDVRRAAEGCHVIIHCAYGNSGSGAERQRVNVEGSKNVFDAALASGAQRVVHVSTLAVYGNPPDGELSELSTRKRSGNGYADSKLEAEEIANRYFTVHKLPVVILQPTVVYGPFAPVWTAGLLQQLKTIRMPLINGGEGLCNAVYVDDVVQGIVLGATREEAVGQTCLISAEEPATWKDFIGAYERMIGECCTASMSVDEARTYWKTVQPSGIFREAWKILRDDPQVRQRLYRTTEGAYLRKLAKSLAPARLQNAIRPPAKSADDNTSRNGVGQQKPIQPLSPAVIDFYTSKARVSIVKAKRLLGYQPQFDLSSGMRSTEIWAKWANLVKGDDPPIELAPSITEGGCCAGAAEAHATSSDEPALSGRR